MEERRVIHTNVCDGSGPAQQRFGGVQLKLQSADVGDHIEVVAGAVHVGFNPRARLFRTKVIASSIAASAMPASIAAWISCRLRPGCWGYRADASCRSPARVYRHLVQQHSAAGGGALAESGRTNT